MAVLELSWTSPGAAVAGCPSVMPTSAGPRIIVGTSTGDAAALDGAGREIWRTPIGASVLLWPAIDTVPELGASVSREPSPARSRVSHPPVRSTGYAKQVRRTPSSTASPSCAVAATSRWRQRGGTV